MSINTSHYSPNDDPFIFATQTKQVFYINNDKLGNNWKVVQIIQNKQLWDVPKVDVLVDDELELLEVEGRIEPMYLFIIQYYFETTFILLM